MFHVMFVFNDMFTICISPDLDENMVPKTDISRYVRHPPIRFTICLSPPDTFHDMFVH